MNKKEDSFAILNVWTILCNNAKMSPEITQKAINILKSEKPRWGAGLVGYTRYTNYHLLYPILGFFATQKKEIGHA